MKLNPRTSQIIQWYNDATKKWYLYSRWQKKIIETSKKQYPDIPVSKNDD